MQNRYLILWIALDRVFCVALWTTWWPALQYCTAGKLVSFGLPSNETATAAAKEVSLHEDSFDWHPGCDVMPYSVLLWIPGKMGETIFVTSSEWWNNPSRCGSPHSALSARGICTTFSDFGHTFLTWLLLCGDSMCMCTSRSTFLHILLAKMLCWSS
jgi:hypothetical protein